MKHDLKKTYKKYPHFAGIVLPCSHILDNFSRKGVQQFLECNRSVEYCLPIIHQCGLWTTTISIDINAYSNLTNEDPQLPEIRLEVE
ncbi:hypothetical protein MtrunA17_Chr7g0268391 [Medicago truncatula]|uniref:Uncharacterized protein n=1 Tax=Medicago truncatula TaxID=3880 RepID=A0A396H6I2_MEDTR|nr:hypothetical protein MtrunA17_Chr7g0268391 [Medicago truncatula]